MALQICLSNAFMFVRSSVVAKKDIRPPFFELRSYGLTPQLMCQFSLLPLAGLSEGRVPQLAIAVRGSQKCTPGCPREPKTREGENRQKQ